MAGLGLVVLWGGYLVLSYGLFQTRGISGVTLADLALPSRSAKVRGAVAGAKNVVNPSPTDLQTQGLGVPASVIASGPQAGQVAGGSVGGYRPVSGTGALQQIIGSAAG